ncbi:hypothetical protein DFH11DRAFT_1685856 [Phellopilus nigrolimitatus]|nr:hypothetical protein DFH11DRAFT_1685856 [Phellopilus nigrolimitatus]
MEQFICPDLLSGSDPKQQHQQQQLQQATAGLDFFSFTSPSDNILAPHPDLFESELDSSLAGFDPLQLQSLIIEQPDAFSFLRADTPTCGPPSTITASSESASAYESISSESFYNYAPSNYSLPFDLDMDFGRASINARQEYTPSAAGQNISSGLSADGLSDLSYGAARHSPGSSGANSATMVDELDATPFGTLPPSPVGHQGGSVYSDYGGSDYFPPVSSNHPSLGYSGVVSPVAISARETAQVSPPQARAPSPVGSGLVMSLVPRISRDDGRSAPRASPGSQVHLSGAHHQRDESFNDPQKKFQCSQCPRAFARAYNLKTHMGTHDPDRPKPFICPHDGCGRKFSRKHDLGRHLVSLHRDEPSVGSGESVGEVRIGIASMKEGMPRCDTCGKGLLGFKRCTCGTK